MAPPGSLFQYRSVVHVGTRGFSVPGPVLRPIVQNVAVKRKVKASMSLAVFVQE
jgi:hypothetical protein